MVELGKKLLNERYRLASEVGSGAFGMTWKAMDVVIDAPVAVKVIPLGRDVGGHRERILREARVLRQLNHPAIPRFVDSFVIGEGRYAELIVVQDYIF
ncbi:MAG: protein kinase, partial [Myxococcota bacterium]|nr:protein kinase [Myxococcota bacterium]